jgi:hypothetical protein
MSTISTNRNHANQGDLPMPPTYLLARDHLQRSAVILQGSDQRSQQLRNIIERTICLIEDFRPEPEESASNILDFAAHRAARHGIWR